MVEEKETKSNSEPANDLVIFNARLLKKDKQVNIIINAGEIKEISTDLPNKPLAAKYIDANGGLVTPSFTDNHFHLDKVLTRDILGATKFEDGFARAREVKIQFTVADVEERACRALELAVAHGLGRMRANVDVDSFTNLISMEGILRARERYSDAIDIDIVAFPQEGIVSDPETPALLREALKMGENIIVGGLPEFEKTTEDQLTHVRTIFEIAKEADVEIDMHCDYVDQAKFKTLEMFADLTIENNYQGRVNAGHCTTLAIYPEDERRRVIDKVKQANMDITVLPVANLQMLGGDERTPMNRGSSCILELLDAGVNVSAGADNMYDIWYRFNRMDPAEVAYLAVLSGGMRTDEEVDEAFNMVTTRATRTFGGPANGVKKGEPADLIVFEASTVIDILRNLPGRRIHIKNGRCVGGINGSTWTAI